MKILAAALVVLAMLVLAAAPSASSPTASTGEVVVSRYDQMRTGVATDVGHITTPTILWTFKTNGTIATSPLAADVDGDGALEVVLGEFYLNGAADASRKGYILDSRGNAKYTVPMRTSHSVAAIADLDADPGVEIVFAEGSHSDLAGGLGYRAFNGEDGSHVWSFETGNSPGEGFFASPALVDVDGDGELDLIAGAMDDTVYALDGTDGSLLWRSADLGHYVRHSTPLADLDGDGSIEVTVHTEEGMAFVFDAATGAEEWQADLGKIVAATPAIGDLDGDGVVERVYSHVEEGGVVAVRGDGTILWRQTVHDFSYRSPTLIDVDGDGLVDVVEGDSNDPAVTAYRGKDGAVLWDTTLAAPWASGALVSADIDGDGAWEIVLGTDMGLTVLSASTGTIKWELALPRLRGEPLVRDIDGVGGAEILVGAGDGLLYVIGTPAPPEELSFAPRTIGYWKHQCTVEEPNGDHLGIPQAYVDAVRTQSGVFSGITSKADVCGILDGPRGNDMRARAEQQLMALWLNVVSGLVDAGVPIDLPMTTATTVGGAIADAEGVLLSSPPAPRAELERAKDIADTLNNANH